MIIRETCSWVSKRKSVPWMFSSPYWKRFVDPQKQGFTPGEDSLGNHSSRRPVSCKVIDQHQDVHSSPCVPEFHVTPLSVHAAWRTFWESWLAENVKLKGHYIYWTEKQYTYKMSRLTYTVTNNIYNQKTVAFDKGIMTFLALGIMSILENSASHNICSLPYFNAERVCPL